MAVLLFGLTAILGDLLSLTAFMIVWWRVLLASISLLFLIKFGENIRKLSKASILRYMGIGVIVGVHWLCFYGSIKYANASVALVCMATTCLFTSVLEPILVGSSFKKIELALGIIIIPAMILIVNNLEVSMHLGVWIGLASAFLAATFAVLNKKYIKGADPLSITFIELSAAWLFLTLILPFYIQQGDIQFLPVGMDWVYMLILVLLCTTLAYVLALKSLHYISAFASNLVINLEPVYGIFLAIWILNENKELNTNFYWGVAIILIAVIIYPLLQRKFYPQKEIV